MKSLLTDLHETWKVKIEQKINGVRSLKTSLSRCVEIGVNFSQMIVLCFDQVHQRHCQRNHTNILRGVHISFHLAGSVHEAWNGAQNRLECACSLTRTSQRSRQSATPFRSFFCLVADCMAERRLRKSWRTGGGPVDGTGRYKRNMGGRVAQLSRQKTETRLNFRSLLDLSMYIITMKTSHNDSLSSGILNQAKTRLG